MNKEELISLLISFGFEEDCDKRQIYFLSLEKGNDRFSTTLMYDVETESFHIIRCLMSGFKEISKEVLMQNHNDLHPSSKRHYIEIAILLLARGITL